MSRGRLKDREQKATDPAVSYRLAYRFTDEAVQILVRAEGNDGPLRFALPIVSAGDEPVSFRPAGGIEVVKRGGTVRVTVNRSLRDFTTERVFNHVPGFQALGLVIDLPPGEEARFEIRVL